jgi:hypothetical protein
MLRIDSYGRDFFFLFVFVLEVIRFMFFKMISFYTLMTVVRGYLKFKY